MVLTVTVPGAYEAVPYDEAVHGPLPDVIARIAALSPDAAQGSDEWLALRERRLTASVCPSVLGAKGAYQTRKQLLRKYTAPPGAEPERVSEYTLRMMEHGHRTEQEAVSRIALMRRTMIFHFSCVPHPELAWLAGSPDGVTADGVLIEIKCPVKREITVGMPEAYEAQVRVLMCVLDLNSAYYVEYRHRDGTIEYMDNFVERDVFWEDQNLPTLEQFWKEVEEVRAGVAAVPSPPRKRAARSPSVDTGAEEYPVYGI